VTVSWDEWEVTKRSNVRLYFWGQLTEATYDHLSLLRDESYTNATPADSAFVQWFDYF